MVSDTNGRRLISPPIFRPVPRHQNAHTGTVQAHNAINGAAMSFIKKYDADNCLSASRNKRRRLSKPMGQSYGANSSEIKPDRPLASRLTFVEDFTLEHILLGGHAVSIELSGSF